MRLWAAAVVLGLAGVAAGGCDSPGGQAGAGGGSPIGGGDAVMMRAFQDRAHDLEVEGAGTVARLLADDTEGGRHQRFILRLDSGQTLLVAHNIDVAPRVQALREGDLVAFRGVYEWNAEGGTIHWTHHDPDGEHPGGWLRHEGRTYD